MDSSQLLLRSLQDQYGDLAAAVASPMSQGAAWQAALMLGALLPALHLGLSRGQAPAGTPARTLLPRGGTRAAGWLFTASAISCLASMLGPVPFGVPVLVGGVAFAWSAGLLGGAVMASPFAAAPAQPGRPRIAGLAAFTPRGRSQALRAAAALAFLAIVSHALAADHDTAWGMYALPAAALAAFAAPVPFAARLRRKWLRSERSTRAEWLAARAAGLAGADAGAR